MKTKATKTLIYSLIATLIAVFAIALPAQGAKTSKHPFTVVVDAGHGGKDPGAQDNGVSEKDINLQVALKLEEFIKKNLKNVRVVMTRDKDEYLTLQQRADRANAAGGNLFISIHVNSADVSNGRRTSVAGSSVHVLGQSKDRKNADVVRRENSVIKLEKNYSERYQGFDPDSDESYIIFEMLQKRFQERSLDLAQDIQKQLKTVAGRRDRGVTQEPFWVLWATSMPAVLVELDFICNPNSAKYIASKQGQNKLAKALFNAVREFYVKEMTLAQQPTPASAEETEPSDGRTYVGDGYAILGTHTAPERKVSTKSSVHHTGYMRRPTGQKRRSAAGRQASAAQTREQSEVNVRTYAEPAALANRPKPAPRQPQTTVAATQKPGAKADRKKAGARKNTEKNTNTPSRQNGQQTKTAKANRKRGKRTVMVTVAGSAEQEKKGASRDPRQTAQKTDSPGQEVRPQTSKQPMAKKVESPKTEVKKTEASKVATQKAKSQKSSAQSTAANTTVTSPASEGQSKIKKPRLNRNTH